MAKILSTEKIMFKHLFILVIICIACSGCSSQGSKANSEPPKWVFGEAEDYSRKKFLIGMGEADTIREAKSRARAEIAKIFSVEINARSVDKSSYDRSTFNQETHDFNSTSIEQEISAKTRQLLEGVEIAEVWKDGTSRRIYALAVLPRLKTAMSLRTEIEQIDNATREQINLLKKSSSLFRKIRLSSDALTLQQRRYRLNKKLKVISSTGSGVAPIWDLEHMKVDHAQLLSQISIQVVATGEQAEKMQQALSNVLANQGFDVLSEGEYTIRATLNSTELPPQRGWFYQKANLVIDLVGEDKSSLGGHEWNFKVASTERVLTDLRVVEKAKFLLSNELKLKMIALMEANN